jgi:hypothetical protein
VQEGEPLEEEVARAREPEFVGAPVLEPVPREAAQHVEAAPPEGGVGAHEDAVRRGGARRAEEDAPLGGGDVPHALLLDLGEEPRLDQRPPRQHDRRDGRVARGARARGVRLPDGRRLEGGRRVLPRRST